MSLEYIKDQINQSVQVKEAILRDQNVLNLISTVSEMCWKALKGGNKIILAGNGGSAADAQHIAAEFVSRYQCERDGLSALALNTDTSMLTAIGNDYGFEKVFSRQVQATGRENDVFIGISTSGASTNIINALKEAKSRGLVVVGLTGTNGNQMEPYCDYVIKVPSESTPRIQESHIVIGHVICGIVEARFLGD